MGIGYFSDLMRLWLLLAVLGSTGNTIYGYYVIGATSGVLYWAEKFATTRILGDTDTITITPQVTLNSKY